MINKTRRWILKSATATPMIFGLTSCGGDANNQNQGQVSSNVQASSLTTPQQVGDLFLSTEEMVTLTALTGQLVPTDNQPGAIEAQCARGIQFLLSAFSFSPAMIFAGGPFSNRAGSDVNHFEQFVELDAYEELAWRIKIEGSQGIARREFNGPVTGWQTIYREGLAALNEAAANYSSGSRFESLPQPLQALVLQTGQDERISNLLDIALPHTMELMYGAPEYGGNAALAGWKLTQYDGDVQPRGYTDSQVLNPDNPGLSEMLGVFSGQNFGRPENSRVKQAALLSVPALPDAELAHQLFTQLIGMTSDEFGLAMTIEGQSSRERIANFVTQRINQSYGEQNRG